MPEYFTTGPPGQTARMCRLGGREVLPGACSRGPRCSYGRAASSSGARLQGHLPQWALRAQGACSSQEAAGGVERFLPSPSWVVTLWV